MFTEIKESQFPAHAEHAAKLEQAAYFSEAAFAWTVAAQHACQPVNRYWAECRAEFCNTWKYRYEKGKAA